MVLQRETSIAALRDQRVAAAALAGGLSRLLGPAVAPARQAAGLRAFKTSARGVGVVALWLGRRGSLWW